MSKIILLQLLKIIININIIITLIITIDNNISSESSAVLSLFLSLECGESTCCEGGLRPGMEGSC